MTLILPLWLLLYPIFYLVGFWKPELLHHVQADIRILGRGVLISQTQLSRAAE
jgi:carbon starvation protein CstA